MCVSSYIVASAFAHALIGGAIGLLASQKMAQGSSDRALSGDVESDLNAVQKRRLFAKLPWLSALAAAAPDADVLMHAFVRYEEPLGHRGAFHSLAFYLVAALVLAFLPLFAQARLRVGICLFLALASHSLLDMLTNGGYGVGLLWPFSNERLFFPWRPIPVSPLSVEAFFTARGLRILRYEMPFALPVFLYALWRVKWAAPKRT